MAEILCLQLLHGGQDRLSEQIAPTDNHAQMRGRSIPA